MLYLFCKRKLRLGFCCGLMLCSCLLSSVSWAGNDALDADAKWVSAPIGMKADLLEHVWVDDGWLYVQQDKADKALQRWQQGVNQLENNKLLIVLSVSSILKSAIALAKKADRTELVFVLSANLRGKQVYYVLSARQASLDPVERQQQLKSLREAIGVKGKLLGNSAIKFKRLKAQYAMKKLHGSLKQSKQKTATMASSLAEAKTEVSKPAAVIDLTTLSADEVIELGRQQYEMGNFEEAVELFDKAILNDANNGKSQYYLGLTYQGMTDYKKAEKRFSRAVELDASQGDAWSHLGEMFYRKGKYPEAKDALQKSLDHGGRAAYASYLKGLVHQQLLELDDAVKSFQRANELNPSFAQKVYYAVGMIYAKQGKKEAARAEFKKAIAISTDSTVGVYANFAIMQLDKPEPSPWHVDLSYHFQYDDNVVLSPNGAPASLLPSGKADFSHVVSFHTGFTPKSSGKQSIRADFNYYRNTHQKLIYMDTDVLSLSVTPSYKSSLGGLALGINANYILVGANSYMYTFAANPSLGFGMGKMQYGSLTAGVQQSINIDQKLTSAVENRDSIKYSGAYTHYLYTHQKKGYVKLGYAFDFEDTKGKNWNYISHKGIAELRYPFSAGVALRIGADYSLQDYRFVDTFVGVKRSDEVFNGSIGLTTKLKWGTLNIDYIYAQSISNVKVNNYKRNIIGSGFKVSY